MGVPISLFSFGSVPVCFEPSSQTGVDTLPSTPFQSKVPGDHFCGYPPYWALHCYVKNSLKKAGICTQVVSSILVISNLALSFGL
ncbi:hypothetical protein D5086_001842 [Populus alba]|uniref:Uncharacterized protein n=1 Tax=Populus alba TaxID=43335 RepID=A0ACC4D014_POPAL